MITSEEMKELRAELDILKRRLFLVMERSGISINEADEFEFNAILDHCVQTQNFKPLQDYQRRKNAERMDHEGIS